jgi:cytochrome P450
VTDIDLGSAESIRDPAGYFARARARGGDVQWSEAQRAWVVLSHAEVAAAFRDSENLSAERAAGFRRAAARHSRAFAEVAELLAGWMIFRDDPAHRRLREPVSAAFTPRAVAALEPEVAAIVERTLDAFPADTVELHEAFTRPIPALVIGALLGADPADRGRFQGWSDELAALVFSLEPGSVSEERVAPAARQLIAFFERLIERERASPSGNLLAALVHSPLGELSPLELVGACTLLLFAGHETTSALLDNALAILLARPDLRAGLRERPSAWEAAVEELLRVAGPARAMARKVAQPHRRAGRALERGDHVLLSIAAANHDEAVFGEPQRIDLARAPNPHLGFGWGPHVCLGANLARLEARSALRALFGRFPDLAPCEPPSPLQGSVMGFAKRRLVVRLRGAGA